jgi:hypothetical protein
VDGATLALSVFGFNLGIELMQLALVAVTLPSLFVLQARGSPRRWGSWARRWRPSRRRPGSGSERSASRRRFRPGSTPPSPGAHGVPRCSLYSRCWRWLRSAM